MADSHTERFAGAAGVRRAALQGRSHDTIERVLNAASRLLVEGSIDELSTTRIANQADVSVGALYRFFPDKQSIIDAIAVRHMEQFEAFLSSKSLEIDISDGQAFLSEVIDLFVEFLDGRPDFRRIAFSGYISPETRKREASPEAGTPGLLRAFMIRQLGMGDSAALTLELRVAIEAGERLLAFAYEQATLDERVRVIAELKKILGRYLFG